MNEARISMEQLDHPQALISTALQQAPRRTRSRCTADVVDPAALDHEHCEAFIDALYEVHCAIFDGVSREAFARYVVRSPAERTRIQVYRDGDAIVGYAAWHCFDQQVGGRAVKVVRSEVGLLPAYRGRTRFGLFLSRLTLGVTLRHPFTPVYGLSCATNPATYCTLVRHAPEVWPRPEEPTPPAVAGLMDELAQQFHLEPVDPARPGVYHVGWQTRETVKEIHDWRTTAHPAARFYLDRNPGYLQGHGMLILVPVGPLRLARASWRVLARKAGRALRSLAQAPSPVSVRRSGLPAASQPITYE